MAFKISRFAKRIFDISGIVLFSLPIIFLIGFIGVLAEKKSKGSVFFLQKRIGKDGREFVMMKFRTMVMGAEEQRKALSKQNEATGFLFKMANDPRETAFGKKLRLTGLDELPQLFNVLKGEMSLVGPRPLPVSDVDEQKLKTDPARWSLWQKRKTALPGMTGLWQIKAVDHHSFDEMLILDCENIDRQSLWFDFSIIVRTVTRVIRPLCPWISQKSAGKTAKSVIPPREKQTAQ